MKVIASVAISVDGFIDDTSMERLVLSSPEDFDDVYSLRAQCDAIMVGAGTIRADNPSLVTKSATMIDYRKKLGIPADPVKVTITQSGNLDPAAKFFTQGESEKIVYCPTAVYHDLAKKLRSCAIIVDFPKEELYAKNIIVDLEKRGIKSLLVEGGSSILTMFFSEGQVDEFRLAIAPLFVGEEGAPRIVKPAQFPYNNGRRMDVRDVKRFGDTVAIYYGLQKS